MIRPAGRVQAIFKFSRVGWGRVVSCRVGSGRVGSGREIFKISRVGSGHPDPTRPDPIRSDPTRPDPARSAPQGLTGPVNSPAKLTVLFSGSFRSNGANLRFFTAARKDPPCVCVCVFFVGPPGKLATTLASEQKKTILSGEKTNRGRSDRSTHNIFPSPLCSHWNG